MSSANSAKHYTRRAKRPTPIPRMKCVKVNARIEARLEIIEPGYIPRKWGSPKNKT